MQLNLWSNSEDSVLTGRQPGSERRGTARAIVTATLDERASGRRLWQGEAVYDGAAGDDRRTLEAIAARLAGQLGQTARNLGFAVE